MKFFLDTNVLIDFILERPQFLPTSGYDNVLCHGA